MAGMAVTAPEPAVIFARVMDLESVDRNMRVERELTVIVAAQSAANDETFTWEALAADWRVGDVVRVTIEKVER